MKPWRWAALCTPLLLAACSAVGPKFTDVEASFPTLRTGQGRIFFYRTSGLGAAVRPDLRLDGQVVGASEPGSFFFVDRPAGNYTVSARTEVESVVQVALREGESAYVQSSITMGLLVGHPNLVVKSATEAGLALPQLAYTGATPLVPGRPRTLTAGAIPGGTGVPGASAAPGRSTAPGSSAGSGGPAAPGGAAVQGNPARIPSAVTMDDLRGLLAPATP